VRLARYRLTDRDIGFFGRYVTEALLDTVGRSTRVVRPFPSRQSGRWCRRWNRPPRGPIVLPTA